MSEKEQLYGDDKIKQRHSPKPAAKAALSPQHLPPIQKAKLDSLRPDTMKYLQRKIGNKATTEWLLAKQGRLPAHNPGGLVQLQTSQPDTSATLENGSKNPFGDLKNLANTFSINLADFYGNLKDKIPPLLENAKKAGIDFFTKPGQRLNPKEDKEYLRQLVEENRDPSISKQFIMERIFLYALTPINDSISDVIVREEGKDPRVYEAYIQGRVYFREGNNTDDLMIAIYPKIKGISMSDSLKNIRIVSPSIKTADDVWKAIQYEFDNIAGSMEKMMETNKSLSK